MVALADRTEIEVALRRVGELLAAAGERYAIVIVGGAALNLSGILSRATTDVDVIAAAQLDSAGRARGLGRPPVPFPAPLERAIAVVAQDSGLAPDWLNAGPAEQWKVGLPAGWRRQLEWRDFAALRVGIFARRHLIHLKLFAAVDGGGRGVHYRDLLVLVPSSRELHHAAAWVARQDASATFARELERLVALLAKERHAHD